MRFIVSVLVCALAAAPLTAQAPPAAADSLNVPRTDMGPLRPRRGSQVLIPAVSIFVPGFGQYVHGAHGAGAAFTGTAVAGWGLAAVGDAFGDTWNDFPRSGRDQLAEQATAVAVTAHFLSAWDAFYRAVPALQAEGKYEFLGRRESVGDLVTAPFDPRFLRRWTTWVDLAQTAVVTALVLSERDDGREYYPLRGRDIAWAGSASLNAAVGEEALFRGWLLPLLHQQTGERFWLANGLQAGAFGALHTDAELFALYISAWAAWEGWIVRRNDWSLRESIFHHFWYDAAVITASLIAEERAPAVRIRFPPIRF